jgi:hypothetical protein
MSKVALNQAIVAAFQSQANATDQNAAYDAIAAQISNAVETYVKEELNALKIVLSTPGTFTGAGTGVVTVTAPGLAGYTPGIP